MTWAEFKIRLFAYNRLELKDWRKVREIAYNSLISFNVDPKSLPKSINHFMPLDKVSSTAREKRRARIAQVQKEYAEKIKQANGG